MKLHPFALALALAGTAVGATSATLPPSSSLKCPSVIFPDAPEPVYVVDGQPVAGERLGQAGEPGQSLQLDRIAGVDRLQIESVDLICARELHQMFGIEAQRTGIVIFTKPGPHAKLTLALDSLAWAQRDHLAKHGAFAGRVTDLEWRDTTGLITVELTVAEDGSGWSATGRHRYLRSSWGSVTVSGSRTPR